MYNENIKVKECLGKSLRAGIVGEGCQEGRDGVRGDIEGNMGVEKWMEPSTLGKSMNKGSEVGHEPLLNDSKGTGI